MGSARIVRKRHFRGLFFTFFGVSGERMHIKMTFGVSGSLDRQICISNTFSQDSLSFNSFLIVSECFDTSARQKSHSHTRFWNTLSTPPPPLKTSHPTPPPPDFPKLLLTPLKGIRNSRFPFNSTPGSPLRQVYGAASGFSDRFE